VDSNPALTEVSSAGVGYFDSPLKSKAQPEDAIIISGKTALTVQRRFYCAARSFYLGPNFASLEVDEYATHVRNQRSL
jgi:hypothetical protein